MGSILLNKSPFGEGFADKQSIYDSVLIDIDSAKFIADTFTCCAHPLPTPAVIGLQIALISPTLNTRPLYLYLTCTFTK